MEKVKLSELKKAIETTREGCTNPISRDALDRIMKSVLVTPPQFLRITKMYDSVMKIKRENGTSIIAETTSIILSNFQEKTQAGF